MDATPQSRAIAAREEAWRDRLLPLMALTLVAAGLFFAAMSVIELRAFYARVQHAPIDIGADFAAFEARAGAEVTGGLDYLRMKTLTRLEADALQRRYHQATTTMLARVWTRQLGFLTGMILALVGAAFVLGRLREPASRLSGEGGGVKGAIETASPGLALAALGSGLMAITLLMPFGVETFDRTVYLEAAAAAGAGPAPVAAPPGPAAALLAPVGPAAPAPPEPGPPPPLQ
jgi:hypothetical protein